MCVHYVIPYIMLFKLVFGFNLLFTAQYVNDLMALFVQVCYLASVRIVYSDHAECYVDVTECPPTV